MSQTSDFYGYLPSKAAALFGVAYFGTSAITCFFQMIFGRYRHYWMITVVIAAVGETIGWGARLWAHSSVRQAIVNMSRADCAQPTDWMPYMIQICSLAVTPVLISLADYILFCRMWVHRFNGSENS